ncbi:MULTISPECIES: nickel pincer cofactor biosynthesis protein LarC [Cyanophyceae]|uniref:nickel pincer cofactor biosynthesis protein LarC n=1 Tax=Cyanophyceae TaxID=3028117 RepID=UPI00232F838E|nr:MULTISPECIES: nickel pincer cofactor biosynthesis protein LarC [Cyanophyceae]MDB9356662.1 nickel pincer cofactor biosynthesis protein LarC [Nodularia spumigena CS-587/03]MDB9305564.1 nickel pincer cofactor biosynthesis protein LarC [Nodularia spumigena CS-591/12]MDB9341252.1 nickel pincer cofactor biosynthesis protein LarC [Nodularia spumigena CS-589/07]MDB9401995.1 nickel pincer cofactor biosynthesis protein LarC [Microcystis aeruginosa CS-567/02-A1]MDB9499091.1 nickel pincer cofactor bios
MIKLAYLQCPTGISGDMCLGALVSLGVPVEYLSETLNKLGIAQDYKLRVELVQRNGQQATKVHVDLLHDHHHHHEHNHHHGRHLPEIEKMILTAELPTRAEAWSLAVFRQLAVAEGAVHGIAPEKVHFHEVGAVDAIVDIVGTCLGLDWLGIASNHQGLPLLYCSALPTGGGTVRAAHGEMAVPVPAVLKLWEMRGCPVFSNGIEKELVTPTGAAIATTLATEFGSPPPMDIKQVGLGAGTINLPISNILRLWLGDRPHNSEDTSPNLETIIVLETQIDDLNPQAIGYVFEALFAVGAVDVFTQPIGMKKSRPGILLTVICHQENLPACEAVLFRETTTLGIRRSTQQRAILQREIQSVEIEYGQVRVKIAWKGQKKDKSIINIQPEYEDCADLARKHNIPWREVQRLALQTWYLQN